MPTSEEMIIKLDGNLFEVFWNTYGEQLKLNKELQLICMQVSY